MKTFKSLIDPKRHYCLYFRTNKDEFLKLRIIRTLQNNFRKLNLTISNTLVEDVTTEAEQYQKIKYHHEVPYHNLTIIPSVPYLGMSTETYIATSESCPKIEDTYICDATSQPKDDSCLVQLLSSANHKNCPVHQVMVQKPILSMIEENHILVIPVTNLQVPDCQNGIHSIDRPVILNLPEGCSTTIANQRFIATKSKIPLQLFSLPKIEIPQLWNLTVNKNEPLHLEEINLSNIKTLTKLAEKVKLSQFTPEPVDLLKSTNIWFIVLIIILILIIGIILYWKCQHRCSNKPAWRSIRFPSRRNIPKSKEEPSSPGDDAPTSAGRSYIGVQIGRTLALRVGQARALLPLTGGSPYRGELEPRSLATATFVKQVDELFDSFNSSKASSGDGKEIKCCVTDSSAHHQYWKKAFQMVKQWRYQRQIKSGKLKKSKPPSQVGRVGKLVWECTGWLCGSSDNPTAVQFAASLKTQILNGLTREKVIGSNCEEDDLNLLSDLTQILTVDEHQEAAPTTAENVGDKPTLHPHIISDDIKRAVEEGATSTLSVAYVSGFIAKILLRNLDCTACRQQLLSSSESPHNLFITFKEWSKTEHLTYPTEALVITTGQAVTVLERTMETSCNMPKISAVVSQAILHNVDFSWVSCPDHQEIIIKAIVRSIWKIGILWWCKRKNQAYIQARKDVRVHKPELSEINSAAWEIRSRMFFVDRKLSRVEDEGNFLSTKNMSETEKNYRRLILLRGDSWEDYGIPLLEWVSSSPDLSPIETLWHEMKKVLRKYPARTIPELQQRLQEIWDSYTPELCQGLVFFTVEKSSSVTSGGESVRGLAQVVASDVPPYNSCCEVLVFTQSAACMLLVVATWYKISQVSYQTGSVRCSSSNSGKSGESDYLNQLPSRPKWTKPKPVDIAENSLVLLKEDNVPPLCWPLAGVVKEVFPGRDGRRHSSDCGRKAVLSPTILIKSVYVKVFSPALIQPEKSPPKWRNEGLFASPIPARPVHSTTLRLSEAPPHSPQKRAIFPRGDALTESVRCGITKVVSVDFFANFDTSTEALRHILRKLLTYNGNGKSLGLRVMGNNSDV
ncbi:hypothetical protein NQ317_001094, partial [Molorchus minor]